MKLAYFPLSAALLLAGCNQTPPVTSTPTAAAPVATAAAADSAAATGGAVAPDATAAAPAPAAAPIIKNAETMKVAFSFKPTDNPDDPKHPRTLARLLVQGSTPLDIELGKFTTRPDMVDAAKGKEANFPAGMVMGFRSYDPMSGISHDLAVLHPDARHLRVVQRTVDETNPEAGKFETSREVPLPANVNVVAAPMPQPAMAKKGTPHRK